MKCMEASKSTLWGLRYDTEQKVFRHVQSRCGVGEIGVSERLLLPRLYE